MVLEFTHFASTPMDGGGRGSRRIANPYRRRRAVTGLTDAIPIRDRTGPSLRVQAARCLGDLLFPFTVHAKFRAQPRAPSGKTLFGSEMHSCTEGYRNIMMVGAINHRFNLVLLKPAEAGWHVGLGHDHALC
jgi:hypothetical protein